ncbi:PilC/PilY family type IV pilus protein [Acinetobacter guillouiae]|uniref:pilus assembly protein n=1 Tax=Acinetobacter guillouiae TaxID=106649 RepID=UPI0028EA619A|nr:PilC/PilY family type IV pilus protein [Acinetobacter guillouiae]
MKINKKQLKCNLLLHKRLLALSMSAFCTGLVLSSAVQASDIDIYQQAKSGDITLMLLLDISGSMGAPQLIGDTDACDIPFPGVATGGSSIKSTNGLPVYDRYYCTGNVDRTYKYRRYISGGYYVYQSCTNNATRVENCAWGRATYYEPNGTGANAAVSDSNYTYFVQGRGSSLADKTYFDRITRLKDGLFDLLAGNTSKNITALDGDKVIGLSAFSNNDSKTGFVLTPARRLKCKNGMAGCENIISTGTQREILLNQIAGLKARQGTPTANAYAEAAAYMMGTTTSGETNSGFSNAYSDVNKSRNNYIAPESIRNQIADPETATCSGQGIYVLTDGYPNNNSGSQNLMNKALAGVSTVPAPPRGDDGDNGWNTIQSFVTKILTTSQNPSGLKYKTAVVGFGSSFNGVPKNDTGLTQEDYITKINNSSVGYDVKQAAIWGVRGDGGWFSGANSEDVVNSINTFINGLGGEIPKVTTGAPTVPKDSLNPSVLLQNAFYPQFQPTPDKGYQLWVGNLKKYKVIDGVLKDKNDKAITDSAGKLVNNYDYWAKAVVESVKDADENTVGSTKFSLMGGVKSQLELRTTADTENRKLLTNRIIDGTGSTAKFVNSTNLRQVKVSDLTTDYKYDVNRGYLISLLGYKVDAENPDSITSTSLANTSELRQVGAVMHSSPILITNKGKITYTNYQLGSSNREDYVLFGTTQGLLHVVDAETGKEKFAFVPNEMIENQKNAFLDYTKTEITGALNKLYYGVDGPWTTYTEYVADSNGALTVGTGRNNQKGKQFAYGGLRMGGRSYYALDLSNINSPKLQFQIAPADKKIYYNGSSNSIEALKYMGQSWSKPTIAWVNWGKKRKRVMFVGGGYDAGGIDGDAHNTAGVKEAYFGYENDTYNQTSKIGGGVYMFDADNGNLLWWGSANATTAQGASTFTNDPNLKYSVVSEIRTEDRDNDGLADHLYFGDLGGQVFRIDLDNNAGSDTALVKTPRLLLNLNSSTAGTSPRFYEMPAFSTYKQAGQNFAVVSIGSGNRSAPLKEYTVGTTGYDYDIVYNIYDKDVVAESLFKSNYTYLTNTSTLANLNEVTQAKRLDDTTIVAPFTTNGWYYRFKSYKLQSAKVFSTPIVLNYRMFVSVFDGSKDGLSGACGAGVKGESFLQQFCMPFGQCPKSTNIECSTGDGCSIGPGLQITTVVPDPNPDPENCDPAKEDCEDKKNPDPKPDDGSNNKNYCISTGDRGVLVKDGIISAGGSKMCLIPQRWYELSR